MDQFAGRDINVAFIGAGDISDLHAEGIAQTDGAKLVGIWNRTKSKAEVKAAKFGCDTVYDTVEELMADDNVDVVYVLTNMETHVPYSLQAIEAGKHVLVEKPVAENIEDIEKLDAAAKAAGVQVAPVHNYIYEPGVERSKDLLESGKLGKLVAFYMMYNIHHPEEIAGRYPGVIRQILTHHSYTMLYLAGKPKQLTCMKATINDGSVPQENIAMVTCELESGALAHLCASFASDEHAGDPWTCMIKVIGQKGATRFSYRDWVENTPAVVHSQTYSCYPYSIRNVGGHFLTRCLRGGESPLSTLEDAVMAQRMVEAAEKSAAEGVHVTF